MEQLLVPMVSESLPVVVLVLIFQVGECRWQIGKLKKRLTELES